MSYLWTPIHVKNPRNEDWEKVDEHFWKAVIKYLEKKSYVNKGTSNTEKLSAE